MGATFYVNDVINMLMNASNSQTPRCNKTPVNHCNCQCTVNLAREQALFGKKKNSEEREGKGEGKGGKGEGLFAFPSPRFLARPKASVNQDSRAIQALEAKVEGLIGQNTGAPNEYFSENEPLTTENEI